MMAVPDLGGASLSSFRGCRNRTGPDYGLRGQAPALVSRRSHGRQKTYQNVGAEIRRLRRYVGAFVRVRKPSAREQDMSDHYHAIVWIDHHEARVFHFGQTEVDRWYYIPITRPDISITKPIPSAAGTPRRIRRFFIALPRR